MPTYLTTKAIEKGTYGIGISFYDENSASMTPNSIYWTLSDIDGSVINNHSMSGITSVQASVDIVLSSLDLRISSGSTMAYESRVVTLTYIYNSDLGNNLPGTDRVKFDIINLSAIS